MSLLSLQVNKLRNLQELNLDFSKNINLLHGDNGSGKTSVLEAIHLLAMGRSFRATILNQVITHDSDGVMILGCVHPQHSAHPLNLKMTKYRASRPEYFLGETPALSVAELAQNLPVQLFNLEAYQLLDAAPESRRKFLDWMMFHVEHSFFGIWQDYHRVLKQRNAVLKGYADRRQLGFWTEKLGELGQALHDLRVKVMNDWVRYSHPILAEAPGVAKLTMDYEPGWNHEQGYSKQLEESIEQDFDYGYTSSGPHRSDIKISLGNSLARSILSTGQMKTFVSMLQLTQCRWVSEVTNKVPILLIDDLPSELDKDAKKWLLNQLVSAKAQIFMTSVERNSFDEQLFDESYKMFHVEHGKVQEVV